MFKLKQSVNNFPFSRYRDLLTFCCANSTLIYSYFQSTPMLAHFCWTQIRPSRNVGIGAWLRPKQGAPQTDGHMPIWLRKRKSHLLIWSWMGVPFIRLSCFAYVKASTHRREVYTRIWLQRRQVDTFDIQTFINLVEEEEDKLKKSMRSCLTIWMWTGLWLLTWRRRSRKVRVPMVAPLIMHWHHLRAILLRSQASGS